MEDYDEQSKNATKNGNDQIGNEISNTSQRMERLGSRLELIVLLIVYFIQLLFIAKLEETLTFCGQSDYATKNGNHDEGGEKDCKRLSARSWVHGVTVFTVAAVIYIMIMIKLFSESVLLILNT